MGLNHLIQIEQGKATHFLQNEAKILEMANKEGLGRCAGSFGKYMKPRRYDITPSSISRMMATLICTQVDRVMEEGRAILAALAGTEKKPESETEDD